MSVGRFDNVLQRGNLVKICGLRQPDHAEAAARSGADLIGFIFAPARRQVSADVARECIEAARQAAQGEIVAVGVFVDASPQEIERTAATAGLDAVQLISDEAPVIADEIEVPTIRVLRPKQSSNAAGVVAEIERFGAMTRRPAGFLIDGYAAHASGGTGVRADWDLAAEVNAARRIMLAGGLDPENVATAIRRVRPLGVDASSGVESGGIKDSALIDRFVRAAKQAFQTVA